MYGRQIREVTLETLERLGRGRMQRSRSIDKGAAPTATLKGESGVWCADLTRSNGITENLPWGGVIR